MTKPDPRLVAALTGIMRTEALRLADDWGLDKKQTNAALGFVGGLSPRILPAFLAALEGKRDEIAALRDALTLADAVVDEAASFRYWDRHEYLTVLVNRSLDERAARPLRRGEGAGE